MGRGEGGKEGWRGVRVGRVEGWGGVRVGRGESGEDGEKRR